METNAAVNVRYTKYKFIALYVVSIILIGIVITAILDPLVPQKTSIATVANSAQDEQLSNTIKTLEANLQELYTLDKQYNAEKNSEKMAAYRPLIEKAEQSLQRVLDSLENDSAGLSTRVNTTSVSNITSPYQTALNLHKLVRNTSINTASDQDKEALVQSRNELQAKDDRIKELESQLEESSSNRGNSGSTRQVNDLKRALEREEDKNRKLTQTSNTQKQTIDKLTRQVSSLQDFLRKQ